MKRFLWTLVTFGMLAIVAASAVLAQSAQPTGGAQGGVQGSIYRWPQAGITFRLPDTWLKNRYQWYEYWGTSAEARSPNTRYINDWRYVGATGERSLLTFTVYGKADWDVIASQPGPKPAVLTESGDQVYVVTLPQANPYPPGSADATTYDSLVLNLAQIKQAFGAAVDTSSPGPTLTGRVWQWIRFTDPMMSFDVEAPENYTLEFMSDGRVAVRADCNQGGGTYMQSGGGMTFSPLVLTRVFCAPPSRSDAFVRYLAAVRVASLNNGQLLLDLFADSGTMIFRPAN